MKEHLVMINEEQVLLSDSEYSRYLMDQYLANSKLIEKFIKQALVGEDIEVLVPLIVSNFDNLDKLVKKQKRILADVKAYLNNSLN